MKIIGIIPARFASTRFPGKALEKIGQKTMIQWVYERCKNAAVLHQVLVATDDQRIFDHVQSFGGNVVMTLPHHISGTDRCMEAFENTNGDAFINIQGDEPFISVEAIQKVAQLLIDGAPIATLKSPIKEILPVFDTNKVKVVCDNHKKALYFSRHAIPFQRGIAENDWLKNHPYFLHIGIYGFHSTAISQIKNLLPSGLENCESLEQLRWLQNGFSIFVDEIEEVGMGIDTPEDLIQANKIWGKLNLSS